VLPGPEVDGLLNSEFGPAMHPMCGSTTSDIQYITSHSKAVKILLELGGLLLAVSRVSVDFFPIESRTLMTQIDQVSIWRRVSAIPAGLTGWLNPGYCPQLVGSRCDGIAITVTNIRVAYGRQIALDGGSGVFGAGSLTAVVGPNGAGKSSLLKALAGVQPLRSGDITYSQPVGGHFAYLPQQSELDRDYPITVAELVALGAWRNIGAFRPLSENLVHSIEGAIAQVGLEGFADRLIAELSAGQFRRALFARLIVQDASLILLDEPFAAVDENTTAELIRLIESWHGEQRTIIAVLHDLDQVRAYFPSTLLLARRCIAWADTEMALSAENLAAANATMRKQVVDRLGATA
jgi:zinc/manganese transport system ATP-binding protein